MIFGHPAKQTMETFTGTLSIPDLGISVLASFKVAKAAAEEATKEKTSQAPALSTTTSVTKARTRVVMQATGKNTEPVHARSRVHTLTTVEEIQSLAKELDSLIQKSSSSKAEEATPAKLASKPQPDPWLYPEIEGANEKRVIDNAINFELPPCVVSPSEPRKVITNGKRRKTKEVQMSNVVFKSVEDAAKRLKWSVQRVKKMLEGTGFSVAYYTNEPKEIVIKSIIVENAEQAAEILGWKLSTVRNILGGMMNQKTTKLRYTGRYRCNYAVRSKKTGLLYQNPFMAHSAEGIHVRNLETEVYDKTYAI